MTRPAYQVLSFGPDGAPPARDLARLHTQLLPDSPVSRLGRRFMESFYYRVLPREGLVFGAVAYVDGQPAGFIAVTHDPTRFMGTGFRRGWLRLLTVLGASALTAPGSMGAMWRAARMVRSRRQAEADEGAGEILSLGVLPAYRASVFVRQSGIRIATDLIDLAVASLRAKGIRRIGAAVRTDNTEAKLFYAGLGWGLERARATGSEPPAVQFVWPHAR